ncbi:hypothetical protein LXL04_021249 [Taraxacum kok-saghyz]
MIAPFTIEKKATSRMRPNWASRVKKAAEACRKPPLGNDNLGGTATTFFITNFPEIWSDGEIWKALGAAGRIVDLFIPAKRNKA